MTQEQRGNSELRDSASKGGRARASVLTSEERSEIARNAVMARWAKLGKLKKAAFDQPLKSRISQDDPKNPTKPYSLFTGKLELGVDVEVYVLNDLRRVVSQRGIVRILGGGRESGNLQAYLDKNPLISNGFLAGNGIQFQIPGLPGEALGYEGTLVVEICSKYLEAREAGKLKKNQLELAKRCEVVIRASAKTGIEAMIDEATGYQAIRAKNALQLKFQAFIADDIQEWARMFPPDFWIELARLEGVRYSPRHRPLRWGRYVMAFVYDAIDPDIGEALREINPQPHFKKNHHQWLKEFGKDKVTQQVHQVIGMMRVCRDINDFKGKFAHIFKKMPLQMTFEDIQLS